MESNENKNESRERERESAEAGIIFFTAFLGFLFTTHEKALSLLVNWNKLSLHGGRVGSFVGPRLQLQPFSVPSSFQD